MEPYQDRVFEERDELIRRMARLNEFTKTEKFANLDPVEQNAMITQYAAMTAYRTALETRIVFWRVQQGLPASGIADS